MPYGGEKSQEDLRKMEACVTRLQAEGHDKVSAIKICKASILGGKKRRKKT